MVCTAGAVAFILGMSAAPKPGDTITIPHSQVSFYSKAQQRAAKRCLRRLRISWRIDSSR